MVFAYGFNQEIPENIGSLSLKKVTQVRYDDGSRKKTKVTVTPEQCTPELLGTTRQGKEELRKQEYFSKKGMSCIVSNDKSQSLDMFTLRGKFYDEVFMYFELNFSLCVASKTKKCASETEIYKFFHESGDKINFITAFINSEVDFDDF